MTKENPIIEEIRQTREQLLAKHGGDLDSLVSELQRLSAERLRTTAEIISVGARPASVKTVVSKKVG